MEEQNTNKILSSEKFTKFNISYPVIVKGWEVCQGQRFEQRYLSIHFQKISDEIFAFKINVTCLNSYDEVIEEYKDISIKDVNRKNVNFFENITLAPNTEKVFVSLRQYVLTDATIGPIDNDNEIVEYEFRRFEDVEDEQAAARLVPSAKGYPIENGSHWYCACGKLNWKHSNTCAACKSEKNNVFKKINENSIEREKQAQKADDKKQEKSENARRKNKITLISVGSVLAVVAIVIFIICATTLPLSTLTVDGMNFQKNNDGTYTLIKCKSDEEIITIPSEIRGVKVTKIGEEAFYRNSNLKRVNIPEEITHIGDSAFYMCTNLTDVKLPKNIKRIGSHAFEYCNMLTEFVVPSRIEYIGYSAFSSNITIFCAANGLPTHWTAFSIPRHIIWNYIAHGETENGIKWVKTSTDGMIIYNYTGNLLGCSNDLIIPETISGNKVTKIWNNAFDSKSLTSVELPNSITSIGNNAFANNKNLVKIYIPDSVTSIGDKAFEDCDNLTIYCESSRGSKQWSWSWNYISDRKSAPVVWEYICE